jgi:hypothetical protein
MKYALRRAVTIAVLSSALSFAQTPLNLSGSTNKVQFESSGKAVSNRVAAVSNGPCLKRGLVANRCASQSAAKAGQDILVPRTSDLLFRYLPQTGMETSAVTTTKSFSGEEHKQ